ncbi:ArsR/SmtB family transcription factor [Georgenia sp. TF02-10]|uniref:ArsR/SmtB family transcription factor n=1 Tax=Georgenia sp. TF02-10 TaxID=2917725 RepID=UPI00352FC213
MCNLVVVHSVTDATVDQVFHALADVTRRDILRRAAVAELSVSRLAEAYPMSFAAVQKHVAVLQRAGLVTKERRGRERLVRTDPDALRRAREALDALESAWSGRVDRMSGLLAEEGGQPAGPRNGRRHDDRHGAPQQSPHGSNGATDGGQDPHGDQDPYGIHDPHDERTRQ